MPASDDDHYACDPADCDKTDQVDRHTDVSVTTEYAQVDHRSYGDLAAEQAHNTVETAESAARRYARQLVLLEGGLTQRGIRPVPTAPVDTWAVELALNTIDRLTTERDENRAEADAIVTNLAKARTALARAEARAGAYLLAHDHLAAVTRDLVDRVTAWPVPVHSSTLDTVRHVLARDLETYLTEPYNDIHPETRINLTPEGKAAAAALDKPASLPTGVANYRMPLTDFEQRAGVASVPRVAREAADAKPLASGGIITKDSWAAALARLDLRHAVRRSHAGIVADQPADEPLVAIAVERQRQLGQWGVQNHPDGTSRLLADRADDARRDCQHAASYNLVTWAHILGKEVAEAMAEEEPDKLRVELVQVAAVATAWIEAIGRRDLEAVTTRANP